MGSSTQKRRGRKTSGSQRRNNIVWHTGDCKKKATYRMTNYMSSTLKPPTQCHLLGRRTYAGCLLMLNSFQISVADGADVAAAHTSERLGYRGGNVRCSGGTGGIAVCGMRRAVLLTSHLAATRASCSRRGEFRTHSRVLGSKLRCQLPSTRIKSMGTDLTNAYCYYRTVFCGPFWFLSRKDYPTRPHCANDGGGGTMMICGDVTAP